MLNIVLYEPDIPWNTGNVGRSCVATGSKLHLVGRLGFELSDKQIRRSGLDYWEKVNLVHHPHWEGFLESIPKEAPIFLFSKFATQSFWQANYTPDCYLIFGCETKGLPSWIREKHADRLYGIPMQPDSVRSLNLSTAAGVVLYEALRQIKAFQ